MEGVDHVHVVQIGGRRLVGEIDRVIEREIPDRERLKFRISGALAALVVMVELGEARCHFAAAGAGRGDNDERAGRFDKIALAEAVGRDDQREVCGVIGDEIVAIDRHVERLEPLLELGHRALLAAVRDAHAADVQPAGAESIDEAQRFHIVRDAEIAAALVALDVVRGDGHDDLALRLHLHEHADLAVRLEARQNARGVEIIKKLAAKLEIELAAEFIDALADALRLEPDVLVVVKADLSHFLFLPCFVTRRNARRR